MLVGVEDAGDVNPELRKLNTKTFGNWIRKHRADQVIRSPALVPVTIKPMSAPTDTLRLRGRGDHVLELPSTVSPHWLGELLKCL